MATEPGGELRIGNALKEARRRAGLDIRTVEEKTKIRTRYLRALESEEWGVLPGHAYVKGFMRTYANLLGLDGDALVDEYRRTVEGPQASPVPLREGVLETRRRLRSPSAPGGGPSRLWIVAALILVIVAILLVLGLTAGDEGEDGKGKGKGERKERKQEDKKEKGGQKARGGGQEKADAVPKTVTIRLVANVDGVPVCLLGEGEQPLIDGQVLSAGSEDSFEGPRFQLRFPSGFDRSQIDLFVAGKRERLPELSGPSAFDISPPREVRQIDSPGQSCP